MRHPLLFLRSMLSAIGSVTPRPLPRAFSSEYLHSSLGESPIVSRITHDISRVRPHAYLVELIDGL